ncbi:MAG: SDR family NAD(P)-dependent oxidoreductase [Myxococcales bacterium]|nr:SDR family NAD(P)-dependent oxidoreductase [Myxococcales bacterium]TDJ21701.1 MAG: SDR family NAD(P)-dependent oxidoreductase [Deltaproteobacteria bacterium]
MSAPVAVVTGASRGIGKRLSVDLATEGYDIVCVARSRRDGSAKLPGSVDETAELVRETGRQAWAEGVDVRDEEAIAKLAGRIEHEFGRCDLLLNNAAVAPPRPALEDSIKRWRLAVDVNLNGPFYTVYHLHALLAKQQGQVINISSVASVLPQFGRVSYMTTKRALEAMTEALAHDLRDKVSVNTLRIDLSVYSEGFEATMPGDYSEYEDPVVVSDAVLWMARQPLSHTAQLHTLTGLRQQGIVRPRTTRVST